MSKSDDESLSDLTSRDPVVAARRLFTEVLGTFLLVTVDVGGAIVAAVSGGEITAAARSAATGLLVMSMIYAMGNVSGAHFNPSVTLAFALRGAFPWKKVPSYWVAQSVGSLLACSVLLALYGDAVRSGLTEPHFGTLRGLVMEITLTAILVLTILGTATRHRSIGPNAALASGGAVALCSLFARPVSGASMNPARSLVPAWLLGTGTDQWIYFVGPVLGASLAAALSTIVHAKKHEGEHEAAEGQDK